MKPIIIAPSLLACDFANLESEIQAVTLAGADWLHIDVMDGNFVPNITMGPPIIKSIKKVSKVPLDVHLMIDRPERYVDDFLGAGSDILTIHVESSSDIKSILSKIRSQGKRAGLTLKPRTSAAEILPYIDMLDLILVMTVEPGFGGQNFMNDQLIKIQFLYQEIQKRSLNVDLQVDGGINEQTASLCFEQGANVFVAGSYIFGTKYSDAIRRLKNINLK